MILIVMGVVGAGKTTIGRLLAEQLGWQFADADDFHPAANKEKIRHGIPLDRWRWAPLAGASARGDPAMDRTP
jgi:gluconokinase